MRNHFSVPVLLLAVTAALGLSACASTGVRHSGEYRLVNTPDGQTYVAGNTQQFVNDRMLHVSNTVSSQLSALLALERGSSQPALPTNPATVSSLPPGLDTPRIPTDIDTVPVQKPSTLPSIPVTPPLVTTASNQPLDLTSAGNPAWREDHPARLKMPLVDSRIVTAAKPLPTPGNAEPSLRQEMNRDALHSTVRIVWNGDLDGFMEQLAGRLGYAFLTPPASVPNPSVHVSVTEGKGESVVDILNKVAAQVNNQVDLQVNTVTGTMQVVPKTPGHDVK